MIVTSDRGGAFGEHGRLAHGTALHQPQIHVPLITKSPGSSQRRVVTEPASTLDIVPTVLELIGERQPDLDGLSLVSGVVSASRWLASEWGGSPLSERSPRDPDVLAMFNGGLKEVLTRRGSRLVFDLAADPDEALDLASTRVLPPNWHLERARLLHEFAGSAREGSPVVDPAVIDRLRSLGYLR